MDQSPAVSRRLCALAALLLAATPAAAQRPGAIRGTVFDSLAGAPLRGARVWVRGTALSGTTDDHGNFSIDSVPAGRQALILAHPDLDSIGLPQLGRPVTIEPGAHVDIVLAVPGLATLQRALCGGRPPMVPYGLGAVFGTVTDAESGTRLEGARVEVSWVNVAWSPGRPIAVERSRDEVTTDSLGNYYECDVPRDEVFTLAAASGSAATGKLDVLIGPRGIGRRDLALSRDLGALGMDSATGLLTGRAALAGRAADDAGRPLAGVRIIGDDAARETETGPDGRFMLGGLPAGSQMVMARLIGYAAHRQAVALRNDDTVRADFVLSPVTTLDTIRVIAQASRDLDQLARRIRDGNVVAITGSALRSADRIALLIGQLPALSVSGDMTPGCRPTELTPDACRQIEATSRNGACHVHLWLDGRRADEQVIMAIPPRRLLAVEWYPRPALAPEQYAPNDECGVLLVWTDRIG